MREQLIQYVELLFSGAPDSEEIKQEILQNTLDRYDDLLSQGKSPEAAYRLAISGIGDVNEILGETASPAKEEPKQTYREAIQEEVDEIQRRKVKAVAIAFYILSPTPLFILTEFGAETIGLCLTLLLVAAATALLILYRSKDDAQTGRTEPAATPQSELKNAVGKVIWCSALVMYLIISFWSGAWFATWLIFPLGGCVKGLANAIIDLKEAIKYEI